MATGKKTGGRKKGTPNRSTVLGKQVIESLLNDYSESGLMADDFTKLDAKDRLTIAEKLMQYVLPKMQATSIDLNATDKKITIEEKLQQLSGDNDI